MHMLIVPLSAVNSGNNSNVHQLGQWRTTYDVSIYTMDFYSTTEGSHRPTTPQWKNPKTTEPRERSRILPQKKTKTKKNPT